jgi:hypothetical protein
LEIQAVRLYRGDQAQGYLWLRLANASDPDVENARRDSQTLRRDRNRADYELTRPLDQGTSLAQVQATQDIVRVLDVAGQEPTRTRIIAAMKVYERDVLKAVTWQP